MQVAYSTHIGNVRSINQDSFFVSEPDLFIIADGMGGHKAGELASAYAVNYVKQELNEYLKSDAVNPDDVMDKIVEAITGANSYVYKKSQDSSDELLGMGTTLAGMIIANSKAYIANVGDSRVYIVRDDIIRQITQDHSYVAELVKSGTITKEESYNHPQKNIITRAIGSSDKVEVDVYLEKILPKDIFVMCTDGVTNMLSDEVLKQLILADENLDKICSNIICEVNSKGGLDNSTLILIKI